MDIDKIRRDRAIKVILIDIIMSLSVILIVFILVAVVAGWRFNADLTVEQNGLVSLRSYPNGAKVIIDDTEEFQATKMSKMLPGGEHKVVLQKEGYESWEKIINVTPGWLLKLEYPRLFKQNRTKESIKKFEDLDFFYVSTSRDSALYGMNNSAEWYYVTNLSSEPKFKKISIQNLFENTEDDTFTSKINYIEWNENDDKVIVNITRNDSNEWGIINLKNPKNSINLTESIPIYKTGANAILANTKVNTVKDIKFADETGTKIYANYNNNLVEIDTLEKTITTTHAKNIIKYTFLNSELAYTTKDPKTNKLTLEIKRIGEEKSTLVTDFNNDDKISFALSYFNSKSYLAYTLGNKLFVYSAREFPSNGGKITSMKLVSKETTGIISSEAKVSKNFEFITFRESARVIVLDLELEDWNEYDYGDEQIRYLDDFIMYRVDEASGKFLAWDFDSTNVRTLVVDKGINRFDATISSNGKFFYYIAKTNNGTQLIREKL